MADQLPEHSPLGASGAERWMNCPGSVELLKHLVLPESDDPSYRSEGTAMHEAAELLLKNDQDAWEIVGQTFYGETVMDDKMARAVQVHVNDCRRYMAGAIVSHVEYGISASHLHPLFYGRLDFGAVHDGFIVIKDLKGGEGIIVEPDDNPQLMYYAKGYLDGLRMQEGFDFGPDMRVVLGINQPRGFHLSGPCREWETTVGYIDQWVQYELLPAMTAVELDDKLDPGPWCRFCPAKLVCPMLTSLFGTAAKANPKHIVNLSDASLGRSYQYVQAVKFYLKAMEYETFRRLNLGGAVPGTKLVLKKANRVWKAEALAEIKAAGFTPDQFMTKPEMMSPSAFEEISAEAKLLVKELAYMPQTGHTVALESDKKPAVKVQSTTEAFGDALKSLQEEN